MLAMEISLAQVKVFFATLVNDSQSIAQAKGRGDRSIWLIRSVALRALGVLSAYFAFRQFCKGFLYFRVFSMAFGIGLGCVAHDLIKTGLNIREQWEKITGSSWRAMLSYLRSRPGESFFSGTLFFKYINT